MANPRQTFVRAVTPVWKLPEVFGGPGAQSSAYQQVKTEEDYQLSSSSEDEVHEPPPVLRRRHTLLGAAQQLFAQCNRRLILGTIAVLAFLILVVNFLPSSGPKATKIVAQQDQKLYLFIPSQNEPDIGFCRTELTAAALRYPTPLFLNRNDNDKDESEQERNKIRKANDHLNDMSSGHDNDMVIILNSAHSWFQLRPEVLMERYYAITEQANKRLRDRAGHGGVPTQSIVFATQSECSEDADSLACFAPPSNPTKKAENMKYLDDAVAIGPVKDMRRLWNRINEKAINRKDRKIAQQSLLAEIFGEQQFHREFVKQGDRYAGEKKLDSVLKALGYKSTSAGHHFLENPEKDVFEQSIGLDYGNELGLSVSHGSNRASVEWVRHGSRSPLPQDIKNSMPPFWSATNTGVLPYNNSWADVPLLTSKRTGGIPAIINKGKTASESSGLDWQTLWMHDYVEKFWDVQTEIPRLPLMSVVDGQGTQHTFWNQELRMERNGANFVDGGWKNFEEYCSFGKSGELILVGPKEEDKKEDEKKKGDR